MSLGFITEPALPLDNLDANFRAVDALISPIKDRFRDEDGVVPTERGYVRTPWPKIDVIIGNPPFFGAKLFGAIT